VIFLGNWRHETCVARVLVVGFRLRKVPVLAFSITKRLPDSESTDTVRLEHRSKHTDSTSSTWSPYRSHDTKRKYHFSKQAKLNRFTEHWNSIRAPNTSTKRVATSIHEPKQLTIYPRDINISSSETRHKGSCTQDSGRPRDRLEPGQLLPITSSSALQTQTIKFEYLAPIVTSTSEPGPVPRVAGPWVRRWNKTQPRPIRCASTWGLFLLRHTNSLSTPSGGLGVLATDTQA
jgi:hypothetical protein